MLQLLLKKCQHYNNDTIFDDYFALDDINENVGLINEIKTYSMLIDVFKEMTNHLEGHCTVDDINEIRAYLNIYFSYLTFLKKIKTHGTKHY